MPHSTSHLAAFDSDPVLARVQASLSDVGTGFPVLTGPGVAAPATGSEIMNALIGMAVKGSSSHAPVTTSSTQPSSLGPALGAGAAGLAVGAGAAAALMAGKGKPSAAISTGMPPAPPAEMPTAKPANGAASKPEAKPVDSPKAQPDPDKVTLALSPDAAKKLPINPENVDTKSGKVKVTPTPTTFTAIPASKPKPAGYEEMTYDGKKYWVSKQDANTYASWNKAFATTGGLKPADATMTPVAAAVPPKPAAPVTPPAPAGKAPAAPLPVAAAPAPKPVTPPPASPPPAAPATVPAPPASGTSTTPMPTPDPASKPLSFTVGPDGLLQTK